MRRKRKEAVLDRYTFNDKDFAYTDDNIRLRIVKNSELKTLVFEENNVKIKYQLKELISISNVQLLCILERNDTKETYLVLARCMQDLIKKGYVENAFYGERIGHHPNQLKLNSKLYDFEDTRYFDPTEIDNRLKELKHRYNYVVDVDDNDLEIISWLRMRPYKFVYDLSNNLYALYIKDEYGTSELVDIKQFKKMASKWYNNGKCSPCENRRNNFGRVLDYVEIPAEAYNELLDKVGERVVHGFKAEGEDADTYRCWGIENARMELIVNLGIINGEEASEDRVYYAIPKPEKLGKFTVSAVNCASYLTGSKYEVDDFVIVPAYSLNAVSAKRVIERDYSTLVKGDYLKEYEDIYHYVKDKIKEELDDTRDEVANKVLNAIKHYNNGTLTDDMIEDIGFMVIDESKFTSALQRDWETNRILSGRSKIDENNLYYRYATIEELAEEFNMAHLLNAETVESVESTEDKAETEVEVAEDTVESKEEAVESKEEAVEESSENSKCLAEAYLNNEHTSKIEVRLLGNDKVVAFIIVDNSEVKLEGSEQSKIEYVSKGIDKENLRRVLKRASLVYDLDFNVESIINSLG